MDTEKKGAFNKYYGATEETLQAERKPIIERKIKRQFQEAVDKCINTRLQAEERIEKLRARCAESYDVDEILSVSLDLSDAESTIAALKAEYRIMFDEDLTVGE